MLVPFCCWCVVHPGDNDTWFKSNKSEGWTGQKEAGEGFSVANPPQDVIVQQIHEDTLVLFCGWCVVHPGDNDTWFKHNKSEGWTGHNPDREKQVKGSLSLIPLKMLSSNKFTRFLFLFLFPFSPLLFFCNCVSRNMMDIWLRIG
ncbi:hypothetical protein CEXT_86131 [Caerostris extrusa]|uniref:Uncharacterized protein n=1 Tax=Caerostris extrusa TaxID=172846 RepID=A0AAV4WQ15_CAEEX|nr:hypothetical protein CEXT_86131 [Caerostris extrusa]